MAGNINVMLVTFILMGFVGFKLLYLQSETVDTGECQIGSLNIFNCFIGIATDCDSIDFISEDGDVCLDFQRFIDTLDVQESDCGGVFDVPECIAYLANVIFAIVQIFVSFILVLVALLIDIALLLVIYISIGMVPIEGAPFIINFVVIGPFILLNFVLVLSFIPGNGD